MSALRRRIWGAGRSSDERDPSPLNTDGRRGSGDTVSVSVQKIKELNEHLNRPKRNKRRNAWIFGLGGLFGLVIALFFAGSNDMIDFKSITDMNLDSLMDVLPAGLIKDAQEMQVSLISIR